jgi:hypothetical protein
VQVAHDLGDRQQVARVDLLFIFLRAARPHGPLDPALPLSVSSALVTTSGSRQRAHPDLGRLVGRHAQGHLVLLEGDDEQLQLEARDFLFFDRDDLAHAMRGIDDEFVGAELGLLGLGHSAIFLEGDLPHRDDKPPSAASECPGDDDLELSQKDLLRRAALRQASGSMLVCVTLYTTKNA